MSEKANWHMGFIPFIWEYFFWEKRQISKMMQCLIVAQDAGHVRFAEKPCLKVLFADLLREKNIVPSLIFQIFWNVLL
jgi:hypothetical protein